MLDKPAARIVSLAPHATELLYAAGAGDRVVGVLSTSDWPPEAAAKPRVGDAHRLDLERIRHARARLDRHVAVFGLGAGGDAARARRPRLHHESDVDCRHRDGHRAAWRARRYAVRRLGARTRFPCAARAACRNAADPRARSACSIEIWNEPLYTIGGKHLISEAIRVCGGENVFASLTLPAPGVSVEAVLAARPEAIIAGADGGVRPRVARRLETVDVAAGGRARQSLHGRRQPAASAGTAIPRRDGGSVRGARRRPPAPLVVSSTQCVSRGQKSRSSRRSERRGARSTCAHLLLLLRGALRRRGPSRGGRSPDS